ncbi:glycoside hydrolase family 25 protein [Gigaspora margarita]|uniref:Glycoside hydrolase family 25 protein n=1 Tax=Gigaspora margarita TaxID=4874 RepID=A0A8H4AIJ8_GIGMA|nr:glycoside hydrolase family 25 protein [Gigaspora margarita]
MKFLILSFLFITNITRLIFADYLAIDAAFPRTKKDFNCALNKGYQRAILRGYREIYGGQIDPDFLQNYNNAIAAGYKYIDVYMFPSATKSTNNKTNKTPQQQVRELVNFIHTNHIVVQTLWLDIEKADKTNLARWNMGTTKNRQFLKEFHDVLESTKWNWGVYSRSGDWKTITGDINWELNSSKKLWYIKVDQQQSLNNFQPFGGWKSGIGKQFDQNNNTLCNAIFDLNIFKA